MNTVTIGIGSPDDATARMSRAFNGEAQGSFISFPTPEVLRSVITPKRRDILRVMTGAGPVAIRVVSRRVGRDVKSVHGDVHALLKARALDRTGNGAVVFPYDEVHVDFVLRAA